MAVGKCGLNEGMADAAIGIGYVMPCNCQRSFFLLAVSMITES